MENAINKKLEYLCDHILTKHSKDDFSILQFKKNKTLISQDNSIMDFYFILDGRLKVTANYENGKSILISFIKGFYILGDIEYISDSAATCEVSTLTDLYYIKVSYEVINKFYKDSHEFQGFLLKYISNKLLQSSRKLQFFNVYPLSARLCSYLYTISDYSNTKEITLPNLQDLSNNLCTSYRHLQRVFSELENNRIIKKKLYNVQILDATKLKELSRGNIYEEQYFEKES